MQDLTSFHKKLYGVFVTTFVISFIFFSVGSLGIIQLHWAHIMISLILLISSFHGIRRTKRTIAVLNKLSRKDKRGVWNELRSAQLEQLYLICPAYYLWGIFMSEYIVFSKLYTKKTPIRCLFIIQILLLIRLQLLDHFVLLTSFKS